MKVKLNPNFETFSGKSGGMLFKTFRRADGKTETRAYLLPRHWETGKYGYKRTAKVTDAEKANRKRFTEVAERLKAMSDEDKQRYNREWKKAKYKFNGKKYVTLRGYIIARLYADMPDNR